MIQKGDVFYSAYLYLYSYEKVRLELEEWHVSAVNKEGIYLIKKIEGVSYGKRSTKNGDFGFLKNIPDWCKKKIKDEETLKLEMFKTKKNAFLANKQKVDKKVKELVRLKNNLQKLKDENKRKKM